jgi:hypothetical protein
VVTDLSNAVRSNARFRRRFTLNSDGQRHPVLNSLTLFTFLAGITGFVLGFIVRYHIAASALGLAAMIIGFYAQMISATREERVLIVTGLIAGFVGLALGLAHGGFG